MRKDDLYTKLIQYRNAYKALSQVSWSIRDCEVRYPMGTPGSEEQLLKTYELMVPEIEDALEKIKEVKNET